MVNFFTTRISPPAQSSSQGCCIVKMQLCTVHTFTMVKHKQIFPLFSFVTLASKYFSGSQLKKSKVINCE